MDSENEKVIDLYEGTIKLMNKHSKASLAMALKLLENSFVFHHAEKFLEENPRITKAQLDGQHMAALRDNKN